MVDNIRPTPKAKAVNNINGIGTKRIAHVIGLWAISIISRSGIKDKIKLTIPVPTEDIEKAVCGI
jgi:hypothetical protein